MMTVAREYLRESKGPSCAVVLVVLCLLAFMTQTHAQEFDVPTLRGSSPFIPAAPKYTRWAGFYVGGQIGTAAPR